MSTPPPKPSEKILVVDDDPVVVKALTMKLQSKGYATCTASDGAEAVKAVREQRPSLVLLDITFPPDVVSWDGFRVMEWLRRLEEAKNIPIIVISGGEPEKYKERAAQAGAVAYFRKPVDTEELVNTIRRVLGKPPLPPEIKSIR